MSIARAVNSSDLTPVEHKMCDVDTLHALGRSNPLGVALLHVRDGLDAGRYSECLELFRADCVKRVQKSNQSEVRRLNRALVKQAAGIVLKEYLVDICSVCLGADYLNYGRKGDRRTENMPSIGDRRGIERRFTCPKCQGSKKPVIDHVGRSRALGLNRETYKAVWERLLPEFANILLVSERRCRNSVKNLLK